MRRLRAVLLRIAGVFGIGRRDREIDGELRAHREMLADEYQRTGMTPAAARQRAAADFGSVAVASEAYRDRQGLPTVDALIQDVRYAVRRLVARPMFATAAIATLALAIGANIAIVSLIDRVVLRPLDVPDPAHLVLAETVTKTPTGERRTRSLWSEDALGLRGMTSFEAIALATPAGAEAGERVRLSIDAAGDVEGLRAKFVTANYFRVLGLRLARGRDFDDADDRQAAAPVVLLSYRLWQAQFGGEATAIGRSVRINGVPADIIGVAPPIFTGTDLGATPPDLFLPLMTAPRLASDTGNQTDGRGRFWNAPSVAGVPSLVSPVSQLVMIGRVRPGAEQRASAEIAGRLKSATWSVVPISETLLPIDARTNVRTFLALLGGAVGLTLLIGCANLASLLLARVEERRLELALRSALGASRARLLQQLLVETSLLTVAGGFSAVGVASAIEGALSHFVLPGCVAVPALRETMSTRTILATCVLTALAAALVGAAPAARAFSRQIVLDLKRAAGSSSRLGAARSLVAVQVMVCTVLVFAGGLFVRTLANALTTDLGFNARNLVYVSLFVPPGLNARALAAVSGLGERVRTIDGVSAVSSGTLPLLPGIIQSQADVIVDGSPATLASPIDRMYVAPEYLTTLGVRLVQGRNFNDTDRFGAPGVAIANQSAARLLWGQGDALDRSVGFPRAFRGDFDEPGYRIVGVVGDVKVRELKEDGRAVVYLPTPQHEPFVAGLTAGSRRAALIIRTSASSAALAVPIARLAQEVGLSVQAVTTVAERMDELLMPQRLGRALLSLLGTLALVLTVVGIHGLLLCVVVRQTKEIGIRLALGASARDIVWLIGKAMVAPLVVGLAAGAVVAWLTARYAEAFMYGTTPTDPVTMMATVTVILASGLLAALVPARRALHIDPIETLRSE